MKKIFVCFVLSLVLVVSVFPVMAVEPDDDISPQASLYLERYSTGLSALGNEQMLIRVSIAGVGTQDKIGIQRIDIDQLVNGKWIYYDTMYGLEHPEFYTYDALDYVNEIYFNGTHGTTYRVTVKAYAKKGNGSDTGFVTSNSCVCI